jgi:hypothetical protein
MFAFLPIFTFLLFAIANIAADPLRIHPTNPRYFTDGTTNHLGSLKAIYLTGSHTWANLINRGPSDPPPAFDFENYLNLLQTNHHNFIRLWNRHVTWYHDYGTGELHAAPLPWPRTGPGQALDGKPCFDLAQFNPAYFDRLRSRVLAANARGIYVSVMLFGGNYECRGGWRGNPFNAANNINSINGDPNNDGEGVESHTLTLPPINQLQEAFVKKVFDTLNDLDNVLFEISNEGPPSSYDWQCHWIRVIRDYESKKPKQHPVGLTALYVENAAEGNRLLRDSPADWISPQTDATAVLQLPPARGEKISIIDSDHWFVRELYNNPQFGADWVWKSFLRGHHTLLMEHLPPLSFIDNSYPLSLHDPGYTASRHALGQTRRFAERLNLAAMKPHTNLATSGFCLANPGLEYLAYTTTTRNLRLDLNQGTYSVEWSHPVNGSSTNAPNHTTSGSPSSFTNPFSTSAVLYLKAK